MVDIEVAPADRADGASRVRAIIEATRIAQMVYAMVELGLPDMLAGGSRADADLASHSGADEPSLRRLLRGLVAADFLKQGPDGRFGLTSSGQALRSDAPEGVRDQVRIQLHEACWRPWGNLVTSILTGRSTMADMFGAGTWDYEAEHPDVAERFNRLYFSPSQATAVEVDGFAGVPEEAVVGDGRRRWPQKPFGRWLVPATFPRSRPGKGKSVGNVAWLRSRRSRPGVRRGWRSQEPVGTAGLVAAA